MKVAIMTSHFTEWNMYIDSCHLILSFVQTQKKSIYDYNSILLSVFIISVVLTYYKLNYPLFFKRYFNTKNILFLGSKEDFFYRSQLSSLSNILPLIIYALVISFFSVYVFDDSNFIVFDSIGQLNLFQKWIFFSLPLGLFIFFRILIIFVVTYFFNFSKKTKKIFILNFIRLTILLSFIKGKEIQVAIYGDNKTGSIEIDPKNEFYDYESKYFDNGETKHIIPPRITEDQIVLVEDLALKAHNALGCKGISRTDFILEKDSGIFYILEVNTQPGMTPTSLVPEIAKSKGTDFDELINWIIDDASTNR